MSADKPTTGSNVGKARRTLGQLWQVPTFFLGVFALLAVAASSPWRHTPQWCEFEDNIAALRQGLDEGQDPDALVGLAEKALVHLTQFTHRVGEVHFLVGSAYLHQADVSGPPGLADIRGRAIDQFEEALTLGVDDADLPRLQARLGMTLCQLERDLPRGIELLAKGLDKGTDAPQRGYAVLLQAYLKLPQPNLEGALTAARRLVELADKNPASVADARLQLVELLLRAEQRADAIKELEAVGPEAGRMQFVRARLLSARCQEEEGHWSSAADAWKDLLLDATEVPGGKARVYYALGLCYRQCDPVRDVDMVQAWEEALKLGGPEGQAAGLRLGEVRLSTRPPDLGRALADWRTALDPVNGPGDFKNPYFELKQVRDLFDRALRLAEEDQDHQRAGELAELYRKVAPAGVAEQMLADAAEALAQTLQIKLARREGDVTQAIVEGEFRRAGQAYEQAAKLGPDASRPAALWRAARCYLAGQQPALAADVLDRYVQIDRNEARLAEGWFSLGEAFRSQGKKDQARQAYYKCIEFPGTPFACRARYQLAVEVFSRKEATAKDIEQAREILMQNLQGPILDRDAHEKSLYKLGWLLTQTQDFDRAAIFLKDAARRYPNNPSALYSREQLGECYRRLAEQAHQKELEEERKVRADLSEEKRQLIDEQLAYQRRTRRGWLEASIKVYQELADELEARARERKDLNEVEATLLRRSLFNVAENRFDLAEYPEALRVYQTLLQRYRGKVEGLIACERICRLVAVMTQSPDQARLARSAATAAVQMAEEDLQRANPESEDFRGQGVWSRQNWLDWIARTRADLQATP